VLVGGLGVYDKKGEKRRKKKKKGKEETSPPLLVSSLSFPFFLASLDSRC
jgi:hypothetical protein